jgi:hypothetical protein
MRNVHRQIAGGGVHELVGGEVRREVTHVDPCRNVRAKGPTPAKRAKPSG